MEDWRRQAEVIISKFRNRSWFDWDLDVYVVLVDIDKSISTINDDDDLEELEQLLSSWR
jgi:hypothetical protein